ncbi:MAG: hypothetical protein COA60_001305 [Robiginitomaculum sp.]|nr:hypothetical protein [Robiginitomaculum sp.]
MSNLVKIIVLSWLLLSLSACATVTRGSNTQFVVQTIPAGATVTTDLQRSRANARQVEYFACTPTPCSITLPRRSDFNVMITLPSHQPFTYAITKEYNKQAITKNTKVTVAAGSVVVGGASIFAGGVSATTAVALPGAFTAAVAVQSVIIAVPAIGVSTGVDLASGSLIDLYPNPLNVQLAVDTDPKQSEELVTMFLKSREMREETEK